MTCNFAFTRKLSLSRPINFDVMSSSLVLHVYRTKDLSAILTVFAARRLFPVRCSDTNPSFYAVNAVNYQAGIRRLPKIDYVTMTSNWHCPIL